MRKSKYRSIDRCVRVMHSCSECIKKKSSSLRVKFMTAQTSLVYLNYDLRADGDEKKKKTLSLCPCGFPLVCVSASAPLYLTFHFDYR